MQRNHLIHLLKNHGIITERDTVQIKYDKKLLARPELLQRVIDATSFLQYSANLKTRLYVLIKNIHEQPRCKTCKSVVKMRLSGIDRYTFPDFCSSACLSNDPAVISKRETTNLKKYGAKCYATTKEGQQKIQATNMARYGVPNGGQSEKAIQKKKQTNLERYGTEDVLRLPEVRNKAKQTNMQKYGVECVLSSPEIRDRIKETNQRLYGVDNVFKLQEFQQKADATMIERHGVASALQSEFFRQKYHNTMEDKYGGSNWWTALIPPESLKILKNKQQFEQGLMDSSSSSSLFAEKLQVSLSTIHKYAATYNIELVQSNYYEQSISDFLTQHNIDFIVRDRKLMKPKELDFLIPEYKLALELNGMYWHSDLNGKDKKYHLEKTKQANSAGIQLMHITDYDWLHHNNIVKSQILTKLKKSTKIPARKCSIVELSGKDANKFYRANHIQGEIVGSKINYGLMYNNVLVAVIGFGKLRFSSDVDGTYELLRFCNIINHTVVGGASKLFKHFIKQHAPHKVVSYCDRRWNSGNLYQKLGFDLKGNTPPNYWYFNPRLPVERLKIYSRLSFQKHKLKDKLPNFDPTLSEWQNMVMNGYDRIWDCGSSVWEWNKE